MGTFCIIHKLKKENKASKLKILNDMKSTLDVYLKIYPTSYLI